MSTDYYWRNKMAEEERREDLVREYRANAAEIDTVFVPTPPASQPTVTLDRETFDNVVSKLKIVERCTPDREGKDLVLDALALLRAAEQK